MTARRAPAQNRLAVVRHARPYFARPSDDAFGRSMPLPVGRVEGLVDGERLSAFRDDRARRLAAAQAAGYLVVRSRTVQFPDGRVLRTYRPYEDDDVD